MFLIKTGQIRVIEIKPVMEGNTSKAYCRADSIGLCIFS